MWHRLFWIIALCSLPSVWLVRAVASGVPSDSGSVMADTGAPQWRRTADGWEDARTWQATASPPHAAASPQPVAPTFAAHPLIVACWQLILAIEALRFWPATSGVRFQLADEA